MTAQHAEFEGFAALAPQTFHTGIALNRMAVRATMRDLRFCVPWTEHLATGQHHRRRGRHGTLDFRNRDFYFGGFDHQFHVAQAHRLAGLQHRLLHALAVDVGAVGRIMILQKNSFGSEHDVAVVRGNRGMFDGKVTLRIAPKMIHAEVQLDDL